MLEIMDFSCMTLRIPVANGVREQGNRGMDRQRGAFRGQLGYV